MARWQYEILRGYPFPEVREVLRKASEYPELLFTDNNRHRFQREFFTIFRRWLSEDTNSHFIGVDQLPMTYMCHGILDIFKSFISFDLNGRDLVLFRGEFPYYRQFCINLNLPYREIQHFSEIEHNNLVVLSHPFYPTGAPFPDFDRVIEHCRMAGANLVIDAAYFGSLPQFKCQILDCVEEVWFSASKAFALPFHRFSVRIARNPIKSLLIESCFAYEPLVAAHLVSSLMTKFGPSLLPSRYKHLQLRICQEHRFNESPSIFMALDNNWERVSLYKFYVRHFESLEQR